MNYHNQYLKLIATCIQQPFSANNRTSTRVQIAPGTQILSHWGPSIPLIGNRRIFLRSAAAEVAWYLSGSQNCTWLNRYTKMWTKWQNDSAEVNAAYGHRWQNYHGVNQLQLAIENLKADPTSRRIWIDTWAPQEDSKLNATNTPCPLGFYLQILNGQLNMSVVMRSSDVAVGLIYDTLSFKLLHNAIGMEMNIPIGNYEMVLLNAHIYEPQLKTIKQSLEFNTNANYLPDSNWNISQIKTDPDGFVEYIQQYDYLIKDMPKLDMFVAI
jgi:thymidylate synthase